MAENCLQAFALPIYLSLEKSSNLFFFAININYYYFINASFGATTAALRYQPNTCTVQSNVLQLGVWLVEDTQWRPKMFRKDISFNTDIKAVFAVYAT